MRRDAAVALLLAGGAVARPAAAQDVLLRYRPIPGSATRAVATLTIAIELEDGGGVAPPEAHGVVLQAHVRQLVSDRVLSARRGVSVERSVDSTRVTLRAMGVQTSDPGDVGGRATARLTLNDRFEVREALLPPEDTVPDLVRAVLRDPLGYGFALPREAVRPGARWTTPLRYPFRLPAPEGTAPLVRTDTTLMADASFSVDSLAVRGGDTLAYLGVRGRFEPVTFAEPPAAHDAGRATLSGDVTGGLVWSVGSGTLYAGALHAVLAVELDVYVDGRRTTMRLSMDVVNRLDPRP